MFRSLHARILILQTVLALVCLLCGQGSGKPATKSKEFDLSGNKKWLDTGIDVQAGDQLKIIATGTLHYLSYNESGPEGIARGWRDLMRIYPLSEANHGALIGRVGDEAAQPFLIGPSRENRVTAAGRLYLGLNQADGEQPDGSLHVKVEVSPPAAPPAPVDESKLPVLTQAMLEQIPTRVADAAGNPGDRVNFLILGSEDKVKQALADAGWVQVNRTVKDALIEGVLATFSKQAYTQLPMSELQLFGRPQDYGYAHADPILVVAARHHFRIWKAPFQVQGETLWVGAGTHDIGIEKDQRNGRLTHKIDPDTDTEREYVGSTLKETGEVAKLLYMTESQPVREAKTATGGTYRSDGRTLIIILSPDRKDVKESATNSTKH